MTTLIHSQSEEHLALTRAQTARWTRGGWLVPGSLAGALFTVVLGLLALTTDLGTSAKLVLAAVALLLVVLVGCRAIGSREFAIVGLMCSIPITFDHHLVYRSGYVGGADGITVELIDLFMVWLLADYLLSHRRGAPQPVRSFALFYIPLAIGLLAELLSFYNSDDITLSIYGFISHARLAALFVVLTITLMQGVRERQFAFLGILCAVVLVGALCLIETSLGVNFAHNMFSDEPDNGIFRAGALDTPTGAAAHLATLLPLAMVGQFYSRERLMRAFAGAAWVIGVAGLMCTVSRGSTGIFIASSIPLVVLLYKDRLLRVRHILLCLVAVGAIYAGFGDQMKARVDEGDDNLTARFNLNGTAINMGENSPWFGEGVNNYWLKMDLFRPNSQTQSWEYIVHNRFLLTFAESGTVGLVAFVWLVGAGMACAVSLARRRNPLGVSLLCSMIALVATMNIEPYVNGPTLANTWMLLSYVAATWGSQRPIAERSAADRMPAGWACSSAL